VRLWLDEILWDKKYDMDVYRCKGVLSTVNYDELHTEQAMNGLNMFYHLSMGMYFKPYPRFIIDKEARTCTIYFPKSCPLPSVHVEGNPKMLKQLASFTACIELHKLGALTDNLAPDTVEKAVDAKEIGQMWAGLEWIDPV
ncbi:endoribonuclease Dicer homolog 2, partial [Tanacetum coccineum]